MDRINFATPQTFVPTETQMDILRTVAGSQGCPISHVVHTLQPSRSESSVRSGVRILLAERCLDGGRSPAEIILRLTSRGRIILQPAKIP